MAQTPNSSLASYLSVDEFVTYKDVRAIGQLSNDIGVQLTQAQLEANARCAAILLSASGEIESALLASERYATADLSAPNGASSQFLKQLVADIAFYRLYTARDGPEPPATVLASYDEAMEKLVMLSNGDRILSFQETEAAGLVSDVNLTRSDYVVQNRFTLSCTRVLGIRNEWKQPRFH